MNPTEPSSSFPDDEVQTAISARLRQDATEGTVGPLADYLSDFPGHEELVAATWLSSRDHDPAVSEAAASAPQRIGNYRIENELGRGGQGVVYRARDERLRRKVALKVLTGVGPNAEIQLARFRREAEVASRLDHPGICGVYETGLHEGLPFIAMRYVEGESLAERIRRTDEGAETGDETFVSFGPGKTHEVKITALSTSSNAGSSTMSRRDLDALLQVFEQLARALHAAHESGIVHRDIKPGNIMLTEDDQPVILDFGLARDDDDDSAATLTQTGDHFGTPAYMSPEQISGSCARLDRRSDVFSLAVTLYEALTLQRPFQGPTRDALYREIVENEPADPRSLNRRIPVDLKAVIECALEKNRDRRYATAADFADDLAAVRETRPIAARRVGIAGRTLRWTRRHPVRAALVAVLTLGIPLVAGLGGYLAANLDDIRAQEAAVLAADIETEVEEGYLRLVFGDPAAAVPHFDAALRLGPDSVEAHAGHALALAQTARAEEALADLDRVMGRIENPEFLLSTRAEVLDQLGRAEEARVALDDAPPPSSALHWFLQGVTTFARSERPSTAPDRREALQAEAESMVTRAVMSSPPRRAYHYQLAAIVFRRGSKSRSIDIKEALRTLWPDRSETWFSIGCIEMHFDPEKAEEALRQAIAMDGERALYHANLGMLLASAGKTEEAIEAYRAANAISPHPQARHNTANALRRLKRFDEAVAEARSAIELDPSIPEFHAGLAQSLSDLDRTDEAIAAYQEALRLRPTYPAALINLGVIRLSAGETDEAIRLLERARDAVPEFAPVHYVLGNAHRAKKNIDAAIAAYRETLRLKPDHARARARLTQLLTEAGRTDELLAAPPPQSDTPKTADELVREGERLFDAGRHRQSIAIFRRALALDETHALAHCRLGLALGKVAEYEASHRSLLRGHELSGKLEDWPHRSDSWVVASAMIWGRQLEKEGKRKDALALIESVLPVMPGLPPLLAERKRLQSED